MIIGSVVSIVVAPLAEMGARLPNQRTSNGAASRVSISRLILADVYKRQVLDAGGNRFGHYLEISVLYPFGR